MPERRTAARAIRFPKNYERDLSVFTAKERTYRRNEDSQAKPGLMHQRGRLKRVPRLFPRHLGCRKAPQLGVDVRQQFIRSFGVALLDGVEDARHVAHAS